MDDNVESIISTHESNHPFSRTEVIYECLQTWRQKLNRNASVEALYAALSRVGCRRRVIRKVRGKYKQLVVSRIRPPALKRSHSYTAGLLGETKEAIQGKSKVELSAYIWYFIFNCNVYMTLMIALIYQEKNYILCKYICFWCSWK